MAQVKQKGSKDLAVLERLWSKELLPKDLEKHYFLYWFALHSGNVDHIAETLKVHRNSIQFQFDKLGLTQKSDALRKFWLILAQDPQRNSFESDFFKFLQLEELGLLFTPAENKVLIDLWRSGFPFRTLGAHYILWALRGGKSKLWIQRKVGYSSHHCMRILVSVLDPRTENGRWLAPLKPMSNEIYVRGPRSGYRVKVKSSPQAV